MAPTAKSKSKAKGKKKSNKRLYFGIGGGIFAIILYLGLQPIVGTIKFGICRVLVEQTLPYPNDLRILSVDERPMNVRMEYATTNEFGEYMVAQASCNLGTDPNGVYYLTSAVIDRVKVEEDRLKRFNMTIPFIMKNPPPLNMPPAMAEDLQGLQR